jgi:signal transduction histidine kinase
VGTRRETLTVLAGLDVNRVYPVHTRATWIGRGESCNLRLRDRGVSRRHACIAHVGRSLVLRDNRAKNGTYVNGRRVEDHALKPGDEIQIGPNVSLLFSHGAGAAERLAQQQAAREQLVNQQMYAGRLESIANIVTGFAHEINTPLGVANTANALIANLVDEVRQADGPERDALLGELKHSAALMGRNLDRATCIVRSFKQLSSRQLRDEYVECDLAEVVDECIATMSADLERRRITVDRVWDRRAKFPWGGCPGHLSQVLIGLVQNTLRYAYTESEEGRVEISLSPDGDLYRLEFKDFGAGVDKEILPGIFEPFVTSGREGGAAGLGLAIAHNIVINILSGEISCESERGEGTTFRIELPRSCPENEEPPRGSLIPR